MKDHNYIKIVKDTISDVKQIFAANNNDDNFDTQQTEFRPTFLEMILLMICVITIKSISLKKHNSNKKK